MLFSTLPRHARILCTQPCDKAAPRNDILLLQHGFAHLILIRSVDMMAAYKEHEPVAVVAKPLAHSPITETEIRLLSYTGHSSPAHISLVIRSFDRANLPPYTALLYEWCAEGTEQDIVLNGWYLPVRLNLWHALQYLPNHITSSGSEYV
jgi:hypothetical protein